MTLTVENLSNEAVSGAGKPILVDNQNREYDSASALSVGGWIPEGLSWLSPDLQPNLPKQFALIFEIPTSGLNILITHQIPIVNLS